MDWASAAEIARAVSNGERSAVSIIEAALARIGTLIEETGVNKVR